MDNRNNFSYCCTVNYYQLNYLLLGMGKSNKSIERFFIKKNINYKTYDDTNDSIFDINEIDFIIKSGAISNNHNIIKEAKNKNIEIISDIELYYLFRFNKKFISITGSNGKTTTANMIKQLLPKYILCGNIGYPIFDFIFNKKNMIVEVSSFMSEYINKYHSNIIVITNIISTHLEYHNDFKTYIKAKFNLLKNIKTKDIIIYNYDDILLKRLLMNYNCVKIPVSLNYMTYGLFIKDKYIYYNYKRLCNIDEFKLIGKHNLYNLLFSLGVYLLEKKINERYIKKNIKKIKGIQYRLELIKNEKNLKIYNDAKSSNYQALYEALSSIDDNITLICGGKKRIDDINIIESQLYKISKVYCYGENREYLYNYFYKKNILCFAQEKLNDIINIIDMNTVKTLLYSPGCVSYDQFSNFEQRGDLFNKLISCKK